MDQSGVQSHQENNFFDIILKMGLVIAFSSRWVEYFKTLKKFETLFKLVIFKDVEVPIFQYFQNKQIVVPKHKGQRLQSKWRQTQEEDHPSKKDYPKIEDDPKN